MCTQKDATSFYRELMATWIAFPDCAEDLPLDDDGTGTAKHVQDLGTSPSVPPAPKATSQEVW